MKNPAAFTVAVLSLIYWIPLARFYWLHPEEYKNRLDHPKKSAINDFYYWLYRPWIRYLSSNPGLGVWGGRLASIFILIVIILILIVSFTGPLTIDK